MRCLLRNGYTLVLLFDGLIRAIFVSSVELPVQDQNLEASIFIEQDQATLFSGKTSPNYIVQGVFSQESIVEFLLIIQSNLVLKSQDGHFLSLEPEELSFNRLCSHLHLIPLS